MNPAVMVALGLITLLGPVTVAVAEPITLQLNGNVNYVGFPSGTDLLALHGDSFTALVTYESGTPLSGPGPADFYANAVLGIDIVMHTAGGDLHYVAEGQDPATTVNFASVHSGDLFFQVTDNDQDGALGSVRGPAVTAATTVIPGHLNQTVVYIPNFLALEIGGPFLAALLADSLPTPPFADVAYTRLSIGFQGVLTPGRLYHQIVVEGSGDFVQPTSVPEPSSLLLLGTALVSVGIFRRARRAPGLAATAPIGVR